MGLTFRLLVPIGSPMLVRALIFDFDGLICDTEGAQVSAARAVFRSHGADLPTHLWLDAVGRSVPEDFWVPWLVDLAGPGVDGDAALREFRRRNKAEIALLSANAGVTTLLDAADAAGLPCAIASSSPTSWVHPLLDRLGLRQRFRTIVCREHAPFAKPAPDLYFEALDRLGVRDQASSVVALEDSHHGSMAATRAGTTCVAVPNALTLAQDFSRADYVVGSLLDVRLDPESSHPEPMARMVATAREQVASSVTG